MKKRCLFLALCAVLHLSYGQTQVKKDENALKQYQKADAKLKAAYQSVLEEYKNDTLFIQNLQNAQQLWEAYRDAEVKARFPDATNSVQPMCRNIYLTELTEERLERLMLWSTGIPEVEVCSGSIKTLK